MNLFAIVPTLVTIIIFVRYVVRHDKLVLERDISIMQEFARDNNLEFSRDNKSYRSEGTIFAFGNADHNTSWMLRGKMGEYPIAMYWHTFTSGSGNKSYFYFYAVVELDLPKALPHIFLGNRNNNTMVYKKEELDVFAKEHLLELEGDFPKRFKVYANREQAAHVLTILNPAFMQAIMSNEVGYDIEFVGKKAFLYFRQQTPTKEGIELLWEEADFIILQLEKQLDTFGPDKNQTKLTISSTKMHFKGL